VKYTRCGLASPSLYIDTQKTVDQGRKALIKRFAPFFVFLSKKGVYKMKEANGTIQMAGETMELLMDAGCIQTCNREVATKLPSITTRLRQVLSRRDVARHLIRSVRIGETVVLVDRKCGYTLRLKVEAHVIRVVGIYRKPPKQSSRQQIVVLMSDRVFSAVWDSPQGHPASAGLSAGLRTSLRSLFAIQ
jgi:hypothetical protein